MVSTVTYIHVVPVLLFCHIRVMRIIDICTEIGNIPTLMEYLSFPLARSLSCQAFLRLPSGSARLSLATGAYP